MSETLTFAGSIYRILKSQKIISLAKILLAKQLNVIDPLCSDNTIKSYNTINSTRHFPYSLADHYPSLVQINAPMPQNVF